MYIIYDLEIVNAIPTAEPRLPGINYCNGWHDYRNMGISVIAYKWSHKENVEYCLSADEFSQMLEDYSDRDYKVIGFNSKGFDDKVLRAEGIFYTEYDILEQVRIAAGFTADHRSVPYGFKYSLDALGNCNGMSKSGNGAIAPVLWQQGKRQEVIDYCINDVKVTERILQLGLMGALVDPNTNKVLQLNKLYKS